MALGVLGNYSAIFGRISVAEARCNGDCKATLRISVRLVLKTQDYETEVG